MDEWSPNFKTQKLTPYNTKKSISVTNIQMETIQERMGYFQNKAKTALIHVQSDRILHAKCTKHKSDSQPSAIYHEHLTIILPIMMENVTILANNCGFHTLTKVICGFQKIATVLTTTCGIAQVSFVWIFDHSRCRFFLDTF